MNEIKFKAWDKIDKKMCEVEAISFHHLHGTPHTVTVNGQTWVAERFELLRYTGLKDKNRVEIYEGDVLRFHGPVEGMGKVYWENCGFRVEGDDLDIVLGNAVEREVIGNIFETPELLKKEND